MAMLGVAAIGLVGMTIFAMASDVRMNKPEIALRPKVAASPLQKLDVAGLYAANCVACHAVDGTGNALRAAFPTIPDFTNSTWQKTQSDENFSSRIVDGKDPLMPAFKGKLSPDQIHALVVYTRAFAVKEPAPK
jgi:mono/diheme cytochrome c family protein